MAHPTKAQVQHIIDNFNTIIHLAKDDYSLDMMEGHACGTTHCHGGWYWVAKNGDHGIEDDESTDGMAFEDGADMLARDLGFKDYVHLEDWAKYNPEIWGNYDGSAMFVDEKAFTSKDPNSRRHKTIYNLQDIIDHWCEVRDRLPE